MNIQNDFIASEESHEDGVTALNSLIDLLSNKPENFLFSLLSPEPDAEQDHDQNIQSHSDHISMLRDISRSLFQNLEKLASLYQKLDMKGQDVDMSSILMKETTESPPNNSLTFGPLSGLSDLTLSYNISKEISTPMDAESIWGQVDLQNTGLTKLASKSIRRLTKALENSVDSSTILRLVDLSGIQSEDEGEEEESVDEMEDEEADEGKDDLVTLRMRQRMQRAMEDDENEEELDSSSSAMQRQENAGVIVSGESEDDTVEDDIHDPAAEKLNDGFFDLNEVEAFADEEEDMVLENGPMDMDDIGYEDDSDAGSDLNQSRKSRSDAPSKKKIPEDARGKRKRYREDEDINALMALYKDAEATEINDTDDEEEEEEYITMTAQDYFGTQKKKKTSAHMSKTAFKKDRFTKSKESVHEWDESFADDSGKNWNEESDSDSERDDSIDDMAAIEQTNQSLIAKKTKHSSSKLLDQTERLEKDMLAEKPWSVLGESKGIDRPVNSLLDKTPEFEFATKMAPVITEEHTLSIEEMIKKRIFDEDWDDVVPRELPDVGWSKRKGETPEVSQEKSKLSLGELYEREYLKKMVGYDVDAAERQSDEEKAKNEIRMLFANLCSRLDALSNYHFAPRPIADEAEVKAVSTPAIAMEEVLPLHFSNARVSAPEEIFATKQGRGGVLRGESELDQVCTMIVEGTFVYFVASYLHLFFICSKTERKRLRQAKKAARRKKRQAKLADEKLISRLQPGLGLNNPYEKRKLREELQQARVSGKVKTGEKDQSNDFKSSTSFFQKMQADIVEAKSGKEFKKSSKY